VAWDCRTLNHKPWTMRLCFSVSVFYSLRSHGPIVYGLRMKLRWKRLSVWVGASLVALVAGALAAYQGAPGLLTVDSGDSKAGAIIVLGGGEPERPVRAAELFTEQAAPVVIASGNGDCEGRVTILRQHGVPESAIWPEVKSRSTKENAEFSVALLRKAGITNAIVVTSWYHSRRALKCFRKAAPEIRFYSRPCYYGLKRSEWSRNGIGTHIRLEYVKLAGYWVCYGISPW
jgi:uncharacterized SAM-binding protein YcdF (DUF218 family)